MEMKDADIAIIEERLRHIEELLQTLPEFIASALILMKDDVDTARFLGKRPKDVLKVIPPHQR